MWSQIAIYFPSQQSSGSCKMKHFQPHPRVPRTGCIFYASSSVQWLLA